MLQFANTDTDTQLADLLKLRTHQAHQHLHEIVDLKQMLTSQSNYQSSLQRYLSVIAPLERSLFAFLSNDTFDTETQECWQVRLVKTQWLCEDLSELSGTASKLPESKVDTVENLSTFIGRTYVLEGLTLGAVAISKMINRSTTLVEVEQHRFFSGYGVRTQELWANYRNWMCHQTADTEEAIEEATITFSLFACALQTS